MRAASEHKYLQAHGLTCDELVPHQTRNHLRFDLSVAPGTLLAVLRHELAHHPHLLAQVLHGDGIKQGVELSVTYRPIVIGVEKLNHVRHLLLRYVALQDVVDDDLQLVVAHRPVTVGVEPLERLP